MIDTYLQWAATTGASFMPSWNNASVAVTALSLFTLCFAVAAFAAVEWFADLAFLTLVAGAIMVPWPAMVAMSIVAVIVAIALSFLHRWLMPGRSAQIEADADRQARASVEAFARDLVGEDAARDLLRRRERE